jgi:thioredoxin reductase (NADPH)
MNKPFIFTVDDDPIVLKAVERDLNNRYAKEYRILSINLGSAALDYLTRIRAENEQVALLLVDQRMPQMSGIDFLSQAHQSFPAARKVLLTAYADTEAAIEAINKVHLDYYLMKPWDPPEELLYPILDDLLGDWKAWMFPPGRRTLTH